MYQCGVGPVLGAADRVLCRGNLSLCVSVGYLH